MHTLTRDKKARESERDKHGGLRTSTHKLETRRQGKVSEHGPPRKSTHPLEMRRRGKVSKTSTGDRRKAHTN
jgi:hypothetical protein